MSTTSDTDVAATEPRPLDDEVPRFTRRATEPATPVGPEGRVDDEDAADQARRDREAFWRR